MSGLRTTRRQPSRRFSLNPRYDWGLIDPRPIPSSVHETIAESMKYLRVASLCLAVLASVHLPGRALAQDDQPQIGAAGSNAADPVSPGINDRFVDPELDVAEWLGRFEIESREVYSARDAVLKACRIEPGDGVADVGAGTGFYSRLFAKAVGSKGQVFAVDIAPRFIEHVAAKSREEGIHNLTTVLCTDRSTGLAPQCVDLVFTCDTYHHFEHPESTLASIAAALKPDGDLVVVDFERIPGKSREFILGHVRAGKEVVRKEIEQAGFEFLEEVSIPEFEENYLLRFRKK